MTDLLKRAVAEAQKLPDERQNAWARMLLDDPEDEPPRPMSPRLAELVAEARAEHAAGLTRPLDEWLDEVEDDGPLP